MNCFNHENVPAVGVCQACGKGLCRTCASETAKGLICATPCAASREPDPAVGLLQRLSEEIEVEATHSADSFAVPGVVLMLITAALIVVALVVLSAPIADVGPLYLTALTLFTALSAVAFVVLSKLQFSQARSFRNAVATLTSDDAEETAPGQHATDSSKNEDRTQP